MKDNKIKVFLLGSYRNNAGPDYVNRCLIENSPYDFLYIKKTGRIAKRVEILRKIVSSNVVVFSGFGKNKFWLSLSKVLHKKTIYLMHGCATYETKINKLNVKKKILDFEKEFLESVDLVLPVSEQYKNWVIQQFPNVEKKIYFLNSGIIRGGAKLCYR